MIMSFSHDRYILNLTGEANTGKSTVINKYLRPIGFEPLSISGLLSTLAAERGITLCGRDGYRAFHASICKEGPDAMIGPIMSHPARLLVLDGLRKHTYAKTLQASFGGNYNTCVLACPREVAYGRAVLAQKAKDVLSGLDAYSREQDAELADGTMDFSRVLAMHDLTPYPIDASRESIVVGPEVVAAVVARLQQLGLAPDATAVNANPH